VVELDTESLRELHAILERFLPDGEVCLVGSRARGTQKKYADIDLLLLRPSRLPKEHRAMITSAFEESDIPYRVDLIESGELTDGFRRRLMADAQSLGMQAP